MANPGNLPPEFEWRAAVPVLHQMQMSGNCYKVRLAAHQLGVPLTLEEYPLFGGRTRRPEYLAKNPNGRVPLLEMDDGRVLPESDAILWYLSEGSPLQPPDAWSRAQALSWMFFEQYSHEPYIASARFWLSYAPKEELEKKSDLVPEWHANGKAALGIMDSHLKTHDWFAGDRYSIADIALYGYTHCAREGGFELSDYPALSSWLARVTGQPRHIRLSRVVVAKGKSTPYIAPVQGRAAGNKSNARHTGAREGTDLE